MLPEILMAKNLTWFVHLRWNLVAWVMNGVKSFSELWLLKTLSVFLDYILRNLEHGGGK